MVLFVSVLCVFTSTNVLRLLSLKIKLNAKDLLFIVVINSNQLSQLNITRFKGFILR